MQNLDHENMITTILFVIQTVHFPCISATAQAFGFIIYMDTIVHGHHSTWTP